jgi:hypothetical protein
MLLLVNFVFVFVFFTMNTYVMREMSKMEKNLQDGFFFQIIVEPSNVCTFEDPHVVCITHFISVSSSQ